jgi:site-specific DNA recombinase
MAKRKGTGTGRAALYVRRSTEEHQAASLEVQEQEGRRFIQKKGWSLASEHLFSDSGISRAEFVKRPGLIAMLTAVQRGDIDIVVTRDDTRLGGDMIRTTLLLQDLTEAGAKVFYYYAGEEVMLDSAVAKFMVTARNFGAELEREKVSQRTHEHLLVKARKGLNVGGRCYGYDNIEVMDGERRKHVEYAINEEQAAVVREIFERYGRGEGLRIIARELNARGVAPSMAGKRGTGSWAPSALFSLLRRSRYIGVIEWNRSEKMYRKGTKVRRDREPHEWLRVEVPHLRIVSDELWTAAQSQMRKNNVGVPSKGDKKGGRPPSYLLTGITRCAVCGGPLTALNGRDGKTPIKVYACAYRRDRGESVCSNKLRRPVDDVNNAVLRWVEANVFTEELLLDALKRVRARLAKRAKEVASDMPQLEGRAAKLRAEIANIVDLMAVTPKAEAGHLLAAMHERHEELTALHTRINATKAAPETIAFEVRRMEEEAKKLIADLRTAAAMEPSKARALVERIFDGKLTATPVETEDGPRFLMEGVASMAQMLAIEGEGGQQKPPDKYVSPGSFSVCGYSPLSNVRSDQAAFDRDAMGCVGARTPHSGLSAPARQCSV